MNESLETQILQLPWHWQDDPPFPPTHWEIRATHEPVVQPQEAGSGLAILGDQEELWVSENENHLHIWRPGFSLSLDLLNQRGETQVVNPRNWENIQRFIYFFSLLACGGLLLHASSLVHRGRALVFPGVSGTGKTTIVLNSPGRPVLSDEISAIRLSPDNYSAIAYGTPFSSDWGRPGEKLSVPLRGIYFPIKAENNRVVPLSPLDTLKRLLPCVRTYTTWKPRLKKMVGLAVQLSERIPGYLLYFRPDPFFWEAIDAS